MDTKKLLVFRCMSCSDDRLLDEAINERLRSHGTTCYDVRMPGIVQQCAPTSPAVSDIKNAVQVAQVDLIVIIAHENCKGFRALNEEQAAMLILAAEFLREESKSKGGIPVIPLLVIRAFGNYVVVEV